MYSYMYVVWYKYLVIYREANRHVVRSVSSGEPLVFLRAWFRIPGKFDIFHHLLHEDTKTMKVS